MRYLLPYILSTLLLQASLFERAGKEIKHFRVYPRYQKAQQYIASGALKKAELLLKEALSIDPENEKVAKLLVHVCLYDGNYGCVNRHITAVKSNDERHYIETYIAYKRHRCSTAIGLIEKMSNVRSKKRRRFLKGILLECATKGKDKQTRNKALRLYTAHFMRRLCNKESVGLISTLLEKEHFSSAKSHIERFIDSCVGSCKQHGFLKARIWIEKYRDAGRFDTAWNLAKRLPECVERKRLQLSIAEAEDSKKNAETLLKEIYADTGKKEDFKRLAYLYQSDGKSDRLEAIYLQRYAAHPSVKLMKEILYLKEKHPRFSLLKRFFPFEGLPDKERFLLLSTLFYKSLDRDRKEIAEKSLSEIQKLDIKEPEKTLFAVNAYTKLHKPALADRLLERLYRKFPRKQIAKRLAYLHALSGKKQKNLPLYISILRQGCDAEALRSLIGIKHLHKAGYAILRKLQPFKCLHDAKAKYLAYRKLAEMWISKKQYGNASDALMSALDVAKSIKDQKNIAFALEKIGNEREALSIWKFLAKYDGTDTSYKHLAFYYDKRKRYDLAKRYYLPLVKKFNENRYLKRLGEIALLQKDTHAALKYWRDYLSLHKDAQTALQAAALAYRTKQYELSNDLLSDYDGRDFKNPGIFYRLHADVSLKLHDISLAKYFLSESIRYLPPKESAQSAYDLAILYAHDKEISKAYLTLIPKVDALPKRERANAWAQLGYWAIKLKRPKRAIFALRRSVSIKADPTLYEALAYLEKRQGTRTLATTDMKNAIDLLYRNGKKSYAKRYRLKSIVHNWNDTFSGYFAYSNANMISTLPPLSDNGHNATGFASLYLDYLPNLDKPRFHIFGLLNGTVFPNAVLPTSSTLQPVVGINYQLFNKSLVFVAIEHLFKMGSATRSDTAVRLSANFFDTYRFDPNRTDKTFKKLYLESAYFLRASVYRLYGKFEWGKRFYSTHFDGAWLPYFVTIASADNDNRKKRNSVGFDIGIGLSYLFWLNEGRYTPHAEIGRIGVESRYSIRNRKPNANIVQFNTELLF